MARRAGRASCLDRYTRSLFAASRGLLFAAGQRCRGWGAQAGRLLMVRSGSSSDRVNFVVRECQRLTRSLPLPVLTSFGDKQMPKYVIEREIPGAGNLSPQELQSISQKSCSVLQNLGPQIQWVESYVTDDKVYCVYIAPSEDMIRAHAQQGGFPANKISEIRTIIDPTTAE